MGDIENESQKRGLEEVTEEAPEEQLNSQSNRKIMKVAVVKVLRILSPSYSVGSILGKGGERIKEIKDSTGAKITVSKQQCFFPSTNERVISIQADCNGLQDIIKFVQTRIREDNFQPKGKADNSKIEQRKRICKLVVSHEVIGKIIGKGGETINELKERHGVSIKTTNKKELPNDLPERVITVEGDHEKVESCVNEIIRDIHEDRRSNLDYFVDYDKYLYSRSGRFDYHYGQQYDRDINYADYYYRASYDQHYRMYHGHGSPGPSRYDRPRY